MRELKVTHHKDKDEMPKVVYQVVWLFDEEVHGLVVNEGAYYSTIKFKKDGFEHEELFANDDFVVVEEISFGFPRSDEEMTEVSERYRDAE